MSESAKKFYKNTEKINVLRKFYKDTKKNNLMYYIFVLEMHSDF